MQPIFFLIMLFFSFTLAVPILTTSHDLIIREDQAVDEIKKADTLNETSSAQTDPPKSLGQLFGF
ncbi:hypothetical protein N7447_004424 [Penicillium robsamsonii]|uniref:uncharacterized protein n=1 Tax=Penicillium robsamsonii TaxID=1792511 RepID=UPI00254896AB|nr:uncharacterized protein N7447_004424 [Penicillium robsamsonii]KAJ5827661.1 hypothetical protein N7447_004424 [Penicillium robsamsonii]